MFEPYKLPLRITWVLSHTGMAGKDDLADAVLGGASDFMDDIMSKVAQWSQAKDDQKVLCMHVSVSVVSLCVPKINC